MPIMTSPCDRSLKQRLAAMPRPRQLAFMLLLCSRMMPRLERFGADTDFPVAPFREYLEQVWVSWGEEDNLSIEIQASNAPLGEPPDTEELDHPLVSAALNAVLSLRLLKSFVTSGEVDAIVEAADLARDTIHLHVQQLAAVPPSLLGREEVANHPLMRQEARLQESDLSFVSSLPEQPVRFLRERREGQSLVVAGELAGDVVTAIESAGPGPEAK